MKEKTLFKIAFSIVIIGLIGLYLICDNLEVEDVDISKITAADVDSEVNVKGQISEIQNRGNITIIKLRQQNSVDVILFEDKKLDLEEGDYVNIYGTVEEYNGEYEIIGDVVRLE